jgi:hypothetical protein
MKTSFAVAALFMGQQALAGPLKDPTGIIEDGKSLLIDECKSWVCPVNHKIEEQMSMMDPVLNTEMAKSYIF